MFASHCCHKQEPFRASTSTREGQEKLEPAFHVVVFYLTVRQEATKSIMGRRAKRGKSGLS